MRRISNGGRAGRFLGIVGGLGALAGADLFTKLMRSPPVLAEAQDYHFLFEQHPFKDVSAPLVADASMNARKFYVFDVCRSLEARGVDTVLLPCFATHTFREELQAELRITLVDMMAALRAHVDRCVPRPARLGILTSDYVRESGLFERYFGDGYALVYPSAAGQAALMQAVYGQRGVRRGHAEGAARERLDAACRDVLAQGAGLIVPGLTELSMPGLSLGRHGASVVDVNQVYADYATREHAEPRAPAFTLGVVGGVGPAATVDFMGKVVKNTPAGCDQDHIRMVVEQNPRIPDRTAHLLHGKTDPSLALLATCRRLQGEGAAAIAIPCNTAHAFVARIQPQLDIPIVNMLAETVAHIRRTHGADTPVGLLATEGTLTSRVYHDAADVIGLALIVPEPPFQALVTDAIFGERGVKAGFAAGLCKEQLLGAVAHLAQRGARVVILGCTELPLIMPHADVCVQGAATVAFVDPTEVLAVKCVQLAREASPVGVNADATPAWV